MNPRVLSVRHAFTLLEVLVSLAIFALAAIVLSAAYLNVINGYRAHDRAQEQEAGWSLARTALLTEPDRAKVESGGTLNLPDGGALNWTAKIEPADLADLFSVQFQVVVTGPVNWSRRERLMLFRPDWSDPADRDRLREASRHRLAREQAP
ncbi:MAG: type II secretion system protein J [Opitutales bacterium]